MKEIVKVGDSIEGDKINGISRKPLYYRGLAIEGGKRVHKFISKFNTKASIVEELSEKDKILAGAITSINSELICEDAIVRSISNRVTTEHKSNVTSTHGSNAWSFPRQTNVAITRSHQEIQDAINKRARLAQNKSIK